MTELTHKAGIAARARHSAELGMWVFLATELLLFGGLFLAYIQYRMQMPSEFRDASDHLYTWIGAVNTSILLIGSFTVAMGTVRAGADRLTGKAAAATARFLFGTSLLGSLFLVLKGIEYYLDYHEGLLPGSAFDYSGSGDSARVELFMFLYFVMTALHALHLSIGVAAMLVLGVMVKRGYFERHPTTSIEMAALYWHFVDIVWVFLFPLLYLV